jgi:hypothetical protein
MDILLSHVDLEDVEDFPIAIFAMVDEWLQQNCPPAGEDRLSAACDVMQTLRHIMRAIPTAFIVPFLVTLRDGLCVWINDELETLEESEYNHVVGSLRHEPGWIIDSEIQDNVFLWGYIGTIEKTSTGYEDAPRCCSVTGVCFRQGSASCFGAHGV